MSAARGTTVSVNGGPEVPLERMEEAVKELGARKRAKKQPAPSEPATDEQIELRRQQERITARPDIRRSEEAVQLIESLRMKEALAIRDPILWPDGMALMKAESVEAIAELVLSKFHRDIREYKILYLFREKMKTRGRATLGKASKADPKLAFFTDATFVMEINHEQWRWMPADARVALVDHELSHFGTEQTETGEVEPVMIPHDVEEFGSVIRRWGLWKNDVKAFAGSVQLALQLEDTKPAKADG